MSLCHLCPNHTPNEMQLIYIEKIFSDWDPIRKAREAFFKFKKAEQLILDPDGMTIVFQQVFNYNLHCHLVLHISGNLLHKSTS